MRILWVSEVHPEPNSGAGGTERLMVQQLRDLGHDVETIWAADLPRRIAHGNLHYALELPGTYATAIQAACRRTPFDIVTVNLGQSYLAGRKLKAQGFPGAFIVRSHGLDDHLDEVLTEWSQRLDLPRGSAVKATVSRWLVDITNRHLHKAAGICDGYVVSNTLDAAFLVNRHGLSPNQIATIPQAPAAAFLRDPAGPMTKQRLQRMLYVAGYHYAKGPHAVALAARQLLAGHEDLSLTWICHPRDHPQVTHLLGPVAHRVRLLSWMTQDELVGEFDAHGIFLYPSLFDGFGKIFLEAMARGLCVVGTPAGGMVDILQHGVNGFLCEYNSPDQMAERVLELQQNHEVARQMSLAAAATAGEYSWGRVGQELAHFFAARCESTSAQGQPATQ